MHPTSNHHEQGPAGCASYWRMHRRSWLRAAASAGAAAWLTPLAERLARADDKSHDPRPQSVIVLWLQGGPSQLDTFDPHPESKLGGDVRAIETTVQGVRLAEGFEPLAELMQHVALVRSVVSKEGDHERATYNAKTGFRPDPTLIHPSIGAVMCHQLRDDVEIPRHVSILPGQWPARGGYLGDQLDAFKMGDPAQPVPDVRPPVPDARFQTRVSDLLDVVETQFARGRLPQLDERKTLHASSIRAALRMMSSEQLAAFDVSREDAAVRASYGDSEFGRGCLAAARLVEVGVRCVEVTLDGWDTHANNAVLQRGRVDILAPALAGLLADLQRRELLDRTIVLCGGEFGRTPRINNVGGRDHWPHGFTVALAGGGIRGGQVYGASSPDADFAQRDSWKHVDRPRPIADLHATIYAALGIDFQQELWTPIGRPMKISEGTPILELVERG